MIEALVSSELVDHPIRLLNEVLPIYELRFYQRNNFSTDFVVLWTIISLASSWIWTIYDKLSLVLSNLDISAYYTFSFSFSLGFFFCFLLSLKLLNIQFPKGFFRFVFNKRTI